METTTIVISLVSLSVAMLTLGWTIYRDAIQRPKFRTSVGINTIYQAGHDPDGPHIVVEALNLGPLPNRIMSVHVRKSWWRLKTQPKDSAAFIYPNYQHWATTPAATRLEVGDTGRFLFPYDKDCFLKEDFVRVGISDGYGHIHWAPRAQLRRAREQYRERFIVGAEAD
jgi:hypothetical protein